MSGSPSHQAILYTSVLDEYNVSMALLNCHPADRAALTDAIKRLEEGEIRRLRILSILKESFEQLRLDVSYLNFDLEATRRERDAAIAKLENQ